MLDRPVQTGRFAMCDVNYLPVGYEPTVCLHPQLKRKVAQLSADLHPNRQSVSRQSVPEALLRPLMKICNRLGLYDHHSKPGGSPRKGERFWFESKFELYFYLSV